jgi:hypothetical protein
MSDSFFRYSKRQNLLYDYLMRSWGNGKTPMEIEKVLREKFL